jgi:hypothetical protein
MAFATRRDRKMEHKCDKCGKLAALPDRGDILCIRGACNGNMKPLKAQKEPVENVLCNVGLSDFVVLAEEMEREGKFLRNPDDHEIDRACGRVYLECAERIRKTIDETKDR